MGESPYSTCLVIDSQSLRSSSRVSMVYSYPIFLRRSKRKRSKTDLTCAPQSLILAIAPK